MKPFTGAIFDMDGVLFDTERVYQQSWQELAEERGIVLDPGYTEAISGTNGAVMCRVIERFYHVPDGMEIMRACKRKVREKLAREVPVKAGVYETVDYLRSIGVRIAVASSSSRAQIESNLRMTGLYDHIDAIISGEEVAAGKPDPEIFLRSAEAIGCEPARCLVFEDSKSGVRAGHAAGCVTFMIPDLVPPSPDIIPLCDRIFDDMPAALAEIRTVMDRPAST